LRAFSAWAEAADQARKEKEVRDDLEVEVTRQLADDSIVYLQENYVVTDGIYRDEHIIFDRVTPEWIAYCQEVLGFNIPAHASVDPTG
jgi:hypothetical protein